LWGANFSFNGRTWGLGTPFGQTETADKACLFSKKH
jgi:hypothetical protein